MLVRQGMWAVVNEGGGTAPVARIPGQFGQLAGKTGSSQVRRVSRALREEGDLEARSCPGNFVRTRFTKFDRGVPEQWQVRAFGIVVYGATQ